MLGGFSGGFLGFGWQAQFGSSLMSKKGNLSAFPLKTLANLDATHHCISNRALIY